MAQPGIGAMLHYLSGGSDHEAKEYAGREIVAARLNQDASPERVEVTFMDGVTIHILDEGQSCCESRYITCDDDWIDLVGGRLLDIETKDAGDVESEYGEFHEAVFIEIKTDKGHVAFTTHNEHNGYYGGFGLTIREVSPAPASTE